MPIRIIIPPRTPQKPEVPRCPIDGCEFDPAEGVYTCSFLHGRVAVQVIGGPL
jgi:hypothetical protein